MNHISKALRGVADKYNGVSLIIRIIVGLIAVSYTHQTLPTT